MKITDRFVKSVHDDVKEKIIESRLTPVILVAVTAVVIMHLSNRQPKIIIINNR